MWFKRESDELKIPFEVELQCQGYQVVQVPYTDKKKQKHYRYYAFKEADLLGKGTYGSVYKAYLVDLRSGKLDMSRTFAVKACHKQYFDVNEFKTLRNYYPCERPVVEKDGVYLITKYIPGVEFFGRGNKLSPELAQLSLGDKFELLQQLMMAVNIMHHSTPQSGPAISHADIKGQNIKVNIVSDSGSKKTKIDVSILDFGFAEQLSDDDPQKALKQDVMRGTPLYMPKEVKMGARGIKSDIYALVPLVVSLLGGSPFDEKVTRYDDKTPFDMQAIKFYSAPYTYTDILIAQRKEFEVFRNFQIGCYELLITFLSKMQSNYGPRADSDEALKFFTTLNNCYKLYSTTDPATATTYEKELIAAYQATMILIAKGLWDEKYYKFKLEDMPNAVSQILSLYEMDTLDGPSVERLFANEDREIEIINSDQLKYGDLVNDWVIADSTDGQELSFTEGSLSLKLDVPVGDKDKGKEKVGDSNQQPHASSNTSSKIRLSSIYASIFRSKRGNTSAPAKASPDPAATVSMKN